jgi:hypothetical protein
MKAWTPYPHQEPMMSHLAQHARGATYSGCGAGKTVVVATTLAESLFDRLETSRWLVVAPKSVAEDTWQREFGKWEHLSYIKPRLLTFADLGMRRKVGGGLEFSDRAAVKSRICLSRAPVDVCDYGMLQWLVKACGVNWPYDGVVFDESGFLRDTQSLRFRAAKHAVNSLHVVKRVIELDGTPLPARYENLLAPFILLDRGDRLGATKTEFRQRWCEPDVVGRDGQIFSWKIRKDQVEPIQAKVRELAVSSDRDIGVELVESDHVVRLDAKSRAVYDQMEHDMIVKLGGENILAANAAVMANKLLQICNGFVFDGDRKVHRLNSTKIDAIVEAVEAMDSPVLLAYLFVPDGEALAKRLGKRMRFANELGAKDQFRAGQLPVLAFHPDSMAHGIDGLQGASNTVFWCGATYRYDWFHQVYKRLHRDGQKKDTVFVRRFIAEGTIEPRIIREVLEPRGEQNGGLLRALRP